MPLVHHACLTNTSPITNHTWFKCTKRDSTFKYTILRYISPFSQIQIIDRILNKSPYFYGEWWQQVFVFFNGSYYIAPVFTKHNLVYRMSTKDVTPCFVR